MAPKKSKKAAAAGSPSQKAREAAAKAPAEPPKATEERPRQIQELLDCQKEMLDSAFYKRTAELDAAAKKADAEWVQKNSKDWIALLYGTKVHSCLCFCCLLTCACASAARLPVERRRVDFVLCGGWKAPCGLFCVTQEVYDDSCRRAMVLADDRFPCKVGGRLENLPGLLLHGLPGQVPDGPQDAVSFFWCFMYVLTVLRSV